MNHFIIDCKDGTIYLTKKASFKISEILKIDPDLWGIILQWHANMKVKNFLERIEPFTYMFFIEYEEKKTPKTKESF